MKKTLAAVALLGAFAGSAMADVTVYGRLDAGVLYTKASGSEAVTTMESGIAGAARWGLKGTEKISDDLKVGFVLEGALKGDTGKQNVAAQIFDREAAIYVYTPYGDLRVGRIGGLGGGSNGGIFGGHVSPFGTVYKNAASTQIHAQVERFNNSVRYDAPAMGGLKVMAQYANGGAKEEDDAKRQERYAAIAASYKVGDLNVVAVYDRLFREGQEEDTQYFKVGAQYKLAPVTFFAGYQHADNSVVGKQSVKAEEVDSVTFGVRVPAAGGNVNVGFGYAKGEVDKKADYVVTQAAVGYTYALSKSTTVYAAATYLDAGYEDAASTKTKQLMAGLYHAF